MKTQLKRVRMQDGKRDRFQSACDELYRGLVGYVKKNQFQDCLQDKVIIDL